MKQLALLSVILDVPLTLLTDPPETDEERLETMTGNASHRTDPEERPARRRQIESG